MTLEAGQDTQSVNGASIHVHIKEIKNRKHTVFLVYSYAVGNTERVYSTCQLFQPKLLRQLESNTENIDSIPCLILTFLCLLHYFHMPLSSPPYLYNG